MSESCISFIGFTIRQLLTEPSSNLTVITVYTGGQLGSWQESSAILIIVESGS